MTMNIPIEELYQHPVVQELLSKLDNQGLENVKIPYVIEEKILMSPGVWNGYYYSSDSIHDAFLKTEWDKKEIRSLFLDHLDGTDGRMGSMSWVGEVKNMRMKGDDLVGDLIVVDKPTAIKLAYGAKMGISPKVSGGEEEGKMINFTYDNFSVVINPAVKTAYINNQEVIKMAKKSKTICNDDQPAVEPAAEVPKEEPVAQPEEKPVEAKEEEKSEEAKEEPKEEVKEEPKEVVENTNTADSLMEALETVVEHADFGAIVKKAKEIKKENPDMKWDECVGQAKSSMKKAEMSEEQILAKAVEILQKKEMAVGSQNGPKNGSGPNPSCDKKVEDNPVEKKKPKEEMSETKKETVEPVKNEMSDKMAEQEKVIQELQEKLMRVESKLNEPDKASVKSEEMSQTIQADPDMAFLSALQGI